jgi:hypothetical protein
MASCSHCGLQQLRQLWKIVAMHRATTNVAVTRPPDRILPVAVRQSGLAPPYTQRRLGSGRLKMYVYANLNGLELPDRAQRRCEDQRICRWRGPPSRSSRPIALGSSVPWSFRLFVARPIGSFARGAATITATATYRAATGEQSRAQVARPRVQAQIFTPSPRGPNTRLNPLRRANRQGYRRGVLLEKSISH